MEGAPSFAQPSKGWAFLYHAPNFPLEESNRSKSALDNLRLLYYTYFCSNRQEPLGVRAARERRRSQEEQRENDSDRKRLRANPRGVRVSRSPVYPRALTFQLFALSSLDSHTFAKMRLQTL